jgi:NAD dependent epimerase/dehydratase family enzyme
MQELRRTLHRPWSPPAPAAALQVGGWLIGINTELVLASQRCRPTHLLAEGFEFAYPQIGPALENLLNPKS